MRHYQQWVDHEPLNPMAMRIEHTEQTGTLRQMGKQVQVVPCQPTVECAVPTPLSANNKANGAPSPGYNRLAWLCFFTSHITLFTRQAVR
jgi:hypothetical protein